MKHTMENYLLLGFMVKTLMEYHQGIGNRTVQLCEMIIEGDIEFGSSYAQARERTMISMSTVHKVFHVFSKMGIMKRNNEGSFYFDRKTALSEMEKICEQP